uniref:Uncharacterized protein n=1 Tax=Sander lucioperca TaxID=283035 RepID=A0A8C9Z9F1_SANLU
MMVLFFLFQNPSEVSDEELNDDLLQSDDEDVNMSGQDVSLNATYSMGTSYDQQGNTQEADYTDDVVNLGGKGDVDEEGYQQEGEEEYTQGYSQEDNAEMPDDQMDYTGELAEGDDGYQDEVLDIQINEPIDGEFQLNTSDCKIVAFVFNLWKCPQVENEGVHEEETKEESDEEDEEDEESGRIRFKSERKDGAVVRLADAGSNRRIIPETLGTNYSVLLSSLSKTSKAMVIYA